LKILTAKQVYFYFGNDAKNSWCFFQKYLLKYGRKSEEELGSAEEQPTSNKIYCEE